MTRKEFKTLTASFGCEYDIVLMQGCYFDISKEYTSPAIVIADEKVLVDIFNGISPKTIRIQNEDLPMYQDGNIIYVGICRPVFELEDGIVDDLLAMLFDKELVASYLVKKVEKAIITIATSMLETQKAQKKSELDYEIGQKQIYINYLKTSCNNILKIKASMNDDKIIDELKEKLIEDITNIRNHEATVDISAEGNFLVVLTNTIYTTEHYTNRRYHIGKMKIKIPLNTQDNIRIFCTDNQREGYWERCYFPHISDDGSACFGNADAQIAQFLVEKMYYATYVTILSYLQSGVDVNDCAGWYVSCWDEVDKEGNIIREGHRPENNEYDGHGYNADEEDDWEEIEEERCICCEESFNIDELYTCRCCDEYVCDDCSTYVSSENGRICQTCLDTLYTRCERCGSYFRNERMSNVDGHQYCEHCQSELQREGW